ncbi:MAG: aminopeptidase P N-terminal domain-containing protein [Fidelibacterota bacterium]
MKTTLLSILILISSPYSQSAETFHQRRNIVRNELPVKSAMVLYTASVHMRNRDVSFEFRPDSDFWYLTGHQEPGGVLLLLSKDITKERPSLIHGEIIFTLPRNPKIEVWTGKRMGVVGALQDLGFDSAEPVDSFKVLFNDLLTIIDTLYTNLTSSNRYGVPNIQEDILDDFDLSQINLKSAGEIIHPLRHVKSAEEITYLRQAIDITAESLLEAMKVVEPGIKENNIEAVIEFIYRDSGSDRPGFPSIVGSGENSTILHYTENNRKMEQGELLLMDVGAEYKMYSADISRTIPVSGRFTEPQAELYSIVLEAQQTVFDSVRTGMTIKELNKIAKDYLANKEFDQYFIHGIGHWLGLDVHDVGGRKAKIKVGSVFTIEPGIYIAEDDTTAPEQYRGIGIRIEDDVLMTEEGPVWLSGRVPKEIKEIERIMRRKSKRFK